MYFSLFLSRWWRWLVLGCFVFALVGFWSYWKNIKGREKLLKISDGESQMMGLPIGEFPDYNKKAVVSDTEIRLMVVGDVMLGRMVGVKMAEKKDFVYSFREVLGKVETADLVMVNLESPIFEPCPLVKTGMKFCADGRVVQGLLEFRVGVAGVANNHIRNYGEEGYLVTLKKLKEEGIEPSDEENLAVIEIGGVKFGFWAVDLVSNNYKDDWLMAKVQEMGEAVDVLVVSVHWGVEYKSIESEEQRRWGKLLVDSGADLVVGHHPHVIQRVEVYKGVPIVYSLGNFVFDQLWSIETREGVVGEFVFDKKKLVEIGFEPIYINDSYQPILVTDQERKGKILQRLGDFAL